jgi:predicted DNA-binding protein (UPF0251 family)
VAMFENSGGVGRPRAVDDLPDRLEEVRLCDAEDMAAVDASTRAGLYEARDYIGQLKSGRRAQ